MNPEPSHPNSIPNLLRDLRDETTTLLRQEANLAKAEMREHVSRIGSHAAHLDVGGFIAYAGIIVLLIGIGHLLGAVLVRAGMDQQVAEWAAPSIIGLLVAVIGWAMLAKAKHAIAHEEFAPRQTIDSLQENKEWAQTKLHSS